MFDFGSAAVTINTSLHRKCDMTMKLNIFFRYCEHLPFHSRNVMVWRL